MKITKRQLKRIVRESILLEDKSVTVSALVKKHASANKSINAAIDAAVDDAQEQGLAFSEEEIADEMDFYYEEMMGV